MPIRGSIFAVVVYPWSVFPLRLSAFAGDNFSLSVFLSGYPVKISVKHELFSLEFQSQKPAQKSQKVHHKF